MYIKTVRNKKRYSRNKKRYSRNKKRYSKILGGDCTKKLKDNFFFIFEKLTNQNFSFWHDLSYKHYIDPGAVGFIETLRIAETNNYDSIYISYVSNKNEKTEKSIEMLMTVFVNNASYITTHMGIFKNKLYEGNKHPRLSIPLHEFSANISRRINENVKYMVTKPVNNMVNIMKKEFKNTTNVFWYGSMSERMDKLNSQNNEMIVKMYDILVNNRYLLIHAMDNKNISNNDRKKTISEIFNNIKKYINRNIQPSYNDLVGIVVKKIAQYLPLYRDIKKKEDSSLVPPQLENVPLLDDTDKTNWKIHNILFKCPYWITNHRDLQSNVKYSVIDIDYLSKKWCEYRNLIIRS